MVYKPNGKLSILKIVDDQAQVVASLEVGSFPEGVAFSSNSRFAYVGNFGSSTLTVAEIDDKGQIISSKDMPLPGPPASLRVAGQ